MGSNGGGNGVQREVVIVLSHLTWGGDVKCQVASVAVPESFDTFSLVAAWAHPTLGIS